MPFINALVDICLTGQWQRAALLARLVHAFQAPDEWQQALAERLIEAFEYRPSSEALSHFLTHDAALLQVRREQRPLVRVYALPDITAPVPSALPQLRNTRDLAQWLQLSETDLAWFADRSGRHARSQTQPLRHYHWRCLPKRRGGYRLLEIPKCTLKALQRRIHRHLLQHLPCHSAAFGFRRDSQALNHARLHQGQPVVLKFDLQDCFLRVNGWQVYQAFRALGYADPLSRYLMALCTHRLHKTALAALPLTATQQQLAQQNHLPQGAPSSPLLSHFALRAVDQRLAALAATLDASYSRYADDLVLSGGQQLQRRFRSIEQSIGSILLANGFALNYRKSACLTQARRQQITGVVVNQHLNIPRREYEALKAELTNCVRHGWRSQQPDDCSDYQAQLRGRLNWCQQRNGARAAKLMRLFAAIDWR